METIITKSQVAQAVYKAIPQLACVLPPDMVQGFEAARLLETNLRGSAVLDQLLENACIAATEGVPICQDTGTVWVNLEVGPDVAVAGDVFSGVDDAVARAFDEARLRKSVVYDAVFDRTNTGNNTPAFCDIHPVDEPGAARLNLMLKGGGSDNASRVVMLVPGAGKEGIVEELVACVREKAANACPPLVVGVGIGSTFDKVAGLAKQALMRPVNQPASDPRVRALEEELLAAVNATGMGPGGLGGATTALAVRVMTAPCHIAALPLAINMGCSAMRRCTISLESNQTEIANLDKPAGVARPAAKAAGRACAKHLSLPLSREQLSGLEAGEAYLLSGPLYTLRDAGHLRLLAELQAQGRLAHDLEGQTIFYAGPTPSAAGRPFGAVGPTTASRMDFATPALHRAGVVATVGKGQRSRAVCEACVETGSVYFVATGGAAAYLATCVISSETVAYEELGTEALRRIEVVDFPVFVGVDTQGRSIYDLA